MGVSDNVRTSTLCSSSHSEGRAGRMPIENGDRSFHAVQPKNKHHQVSALRDFPPGCGRVAQPTNSRPTDIEDAQYTIQSNQEIPGSLSWPKEGEELKNDESVGLQLLQEASLEGLKAAGLTEHVKAVEQETPSMLKAGEKLESHKDAGLTENVKAVEQETPSMSKDLHQMDAVASKEDMVHPSSSKSMSPFNFPISVPNCNGMKNVVARKYPPPRRSVSAVREFPLDCGPNAPRVHNEETRQVPASLDDKSLDQGISHIDDKTASANLNPQVLAPLHIKSLDKDISVVAEKSLNATLEDDTEQLGVINQEENAQETEFREKVSKLTVEKLEPDSVVPPTKDAEKKVKNEMGNEGANEKCPTPYSESSQSERSLDTAKGTLGKRREKEIVVYNGDVDTKKELPNTHVHPRKLKNELFEDSEPSPDRVISQGQIALGGMER